MDMDLKLPYYSLPIAPTDEYDEYKEAKKIIAGEITCSIREGWRDYRKGGILTLGCPGVEKDGSWSNDWEIASDIENVRHCEVRDVTEAEWRRAGFGSRQDMHDGLKKHYKTIGWNSKVTVICWTNVRGALVENHRVEMENRRAEMVLRNKQSEGVCEEWKDEFLTLIGGKSFASEDFIQHINEMKDDGCADCCDAILREFIKKSMGMHRLARELGVMRKKQKSGGS